METYKDTKKGTQYQNIPFSELFDRRANRQNHYFEKTSFVCVCCLTLIVIAFDITSFLFYRENELLTRYHTNERHTERKLSAWKEFYFEWSWLDFKVTKQDLKQDKDKSLQNSKWMMSQAELRMMEPNICIN